MQRRSQTLAIIGTFTLDKLRPWRGRATEGFGGLYYSLMPLAGLLRRRDRILPVARMGRDLRVPLQQVFDRFPSIHSDGLVFHDGPDNTVESWYPEPDRREEISLHVPRPLGVGDVQHVPEVDCLYLNCISGRDITLGAMTALRNRIGCPVYLDYHSMTLGLRTTGHRFRRYPKAWQQWTALTDIVQFNQEEASLLGRQAVETETDACRFARIVFELGPRIVLLTLGRRGAWLFDGTPRKPELIAPKLLAQREDVPGCGDSFGAGFVAEYILTGNAQAAVQCGQYSASRVAMLGGSRRLAALAADIDFRKPRRWRNP